MDPSPPNSRLFLNSVLQKYSWAAGATRGTESAVARYTRDIQKAFAEVDGLLAGFQYLEKAPPTNHSPPARSPSACSAPSVCVTEAPYMENTSEFQYANQISDLDLRDSEEQPATESIDEPPQPQSSDNNEHPRQRLDSQWTNIRNLRKETEYHHRRFLDITKNWDDSCICKLRTTYSSARWTRRQGLLIFRDVLQGRRPNTLKGIFAFASVSYAVSKLLRKRNRIREEDILADLRLWRDCITDTNEREAFNNLAQKLWPEAKEHLHFIPIQQKKTREDGAPSSAVENFIGSHELGSRFNELFPAGAYQIGNDNDSFPSYTSGISTLFDGVNCDQDYVSTLDQLMYDHVVDKTRHTHDEFDFAFFLSTTDPPPPENPRQSKSPDTTTQTTVDAYHPLVVDHSSQPTDRELQNDSPPTQYELKAVPLRETALFLVIIVFLSEIRGLLDVLSGRKLPLSSPTTNFEFKADEEDHKLFFQSAQETFFKPRRHSRFCHDQRFLSLLSVAETYTEWGKLRSIEEVVYYLISIAGAVFPPGELFQNFSLWVLIGNIPSHFETDVASPVNSQQYQPDRDSSSTPAPSSPSKKSKPWRCGYQDCDVQCESQSGLHKHKEQNHGRKEKLPCPLPRCTYGSIRRDRVRSHFLRQHPSQQLPPVLQEKNRRSKFPMA